MLKLLFMLLIFVPLQCFSTTLDPDILAYDQGTVEINSEIDQYDNLQADTPIQGSVMITHDKNNIVDLGSFQLGDKPLKVIFVRSMAMSPDNNVLVSIYKFQLDGMKSGFHTLPAIKVKVSGVEYAALPMTVEIP